MNTTETQIEQAMADEAGWRLDALLEHYSRNKYARTIQSSITPTSAITVDVYCVLKAFGVTCPARQHAIKKLLMPGERGKGNFEQDMLEAISAVQRSIELSRGP